MSNALSHTYSGNELAGQNGLALGEEPDSDFAQISPLGAHADAEYELGSNPSAFLHQAMQSTRNLLALSTVARLIMDKERRKGTAYIPAQPQRSCAPRSGELFFSNLHQRQDADSSTAHLQDRIRELEVSVKRIDDSDLPEVTKNTVRQRMLEQLDVLRACSPSHHASGME